MNKPDPRAQLSVGNGFSYSRPYFEELVDTALVHAKKLGASDAGAEASEGCGLSVSVRKGELENVERNRDKSLGVTVYIGNRRGNASTSGVVVNLVEASSRRLQASMLRENDPRVSEVKSLLDALANARGDEQWETAERSAEQLVTWITEMAE